MMKSAVFSIFFIFITCSIAVGQSELSIRVLDKSGTALGDADVYIQPDKSLLKTNRMGMVKTHLPKGEKSVTVFKTGYKNELFTLTFYSDTTLTVELSVLSADLEVVEIKLEENAGFGLTRMRSVEGFGIYAGKKNEVLLPDEIDANKATNSARQVYARIPGLNIWESDGAGIQLGIGVRGLSPNRTANINVRQNGYDISADALGYPESYYTPPLEAVERIEFIRGAASLQYGTQFGGMLNFVMKHGEQKKPLEVSTRQTVGSNGLFSSFNSLGGTKGKSSYYGYYQYKRGDGWRDNSGFEVNTAYAAYSYAIKEDWKISFDFTHMDYLAQQGGGLTDAQFEDDPRQSNRNRNWFKVNWNIASINLDGKISKSSSVNFRTFGLLAKRQSLGYLGSANRLDDESRNRDLIYGEFRNLGGELRFMHRYEIAGRRNILLLGGRAYYGNSLSQQGSANSNSTPDFEFLNPNQPDKSDYDFDNINYALFAEQIIYLSEKLTLTPGIRYENILTSADGNYYSYLKNTVGDTLEVNEYAEIRERNRGIVLGGIGLSYTHSEKLETYGNISQNYRAINYSDIRIDNPSLQIDPNIEDERGFNADIGVRGGNEHFRYDVSLYYLAYKNRIGSIQMRDPETFQFYRYRTNIADSRAVGIEAYAEWLAVKQTDEQHFGLAIFGNFALNEAEYSEDNDLSISGNKVELTPEIMIRSGLRSTWKNISATFQVSMTGEQYTDATNAVQTPNAVNGIIPTYTVLDLSLAYKPGKFKIETGINNLSNAAYYTRRADGYPGPGIIPSDGISGYLTVGYTF
ncbi:TonB-dependent receptor [Cryomorpha ignava]|uniref:TonB-dependent receptor n=1 Tax=Cryomorpha ignava TaxID=101383 RepID=A0A7K3WRL3_9FLAO|nr:TonB-dependent receptor [Cryomorpha ignava]NEN24320.1 TonB-dependent receptor [Cryomorpha ignava]